MIHIEKPITTPKALQEVQAQIESDLLRQRAKFKWTNNLYSEPIKKELKDLYHNKCAFCQTELTENDTEAKFTVEHYRPKTLYWWLGNEWTNLFPTCRKCNDNKKDDFPLRSERKRLLTVPLVGAAIDRIQCGAEHPALLDEEPYFLHPEVDLRKNYFEFCTDGSIVPAQGLSNWEQSRAQTMIAKFLGIPSVTEKRLRRIKDFQNDLSRAVDNFLQICGSDYDKKHIKLAFNPFFEKLLVATAHEAEFSQLGYWMSEKFEEFFLIGYPAEIQALLRYALKNFITDYRY